MAGHLRDEVLRVAKDRELTLPKQPRAKKASKSRRGAKKKDTGVREPIWKTRTAKPKKGATGAPPPPTTTTTTPTTSNSSNNNADDIDNNDSSSIGVSGGVSGFAVGSHNPWPREDLELLCGDPLPVGEGFALQAQLYSELVDALADLEDDCARLEAEATALRANSVAVAAELREAKARRREGALEWNAAMVAAQYDGRIAQIKVRPFNHATTTTTTTTTKNFAAFILFGQSMRLIDG